jgi:SlyX protein
MSPLPDPQIVNLEITISHQGKSIDDLSAAVAEQWKLIERLQKKVDVLTSRFLELEETAAPGVEAAKPPHW